MLHGKPPSDHLFPFSVTLLSLANVGLSFGANELFKDVTATVAEGERWGIIGRNGAGKSSIFKLTTHHLLGGRSARSAPGGAT